jgi:hypothetical protein
VTRSRPRRPSSSPETRSTPAKSAVVCGSGSPGSSPRSLRGCSCHPTTARRRARCCRRRGRVVRGRERVFARLLYPRTQQLAAAAAGLPVRDPHEVFEVVLGRTPRPRSRSPIPRQPRMRGRSGRDRRAASLGSGAPRGHRPSQAPGRTSASLQPTPSWSVIRPAFAIACSMTSSGSTKSTSRRETPQPGPTRGCCRRQTCPTGPAWAHEPVHLLACSSILAPPCLHRWTVCP